MTTIGAKTTSVFAAVVLAGTLAACAGSDPAETCGDGVLDPHEACDDGNTSSGDGCSAGCALEVPGAHADEVIDAPGATGTGYGDPTRAINGVRGGGATMQGLDVYSIGIGEGEHLVLGFSGRRVVDGPGDDLVVFENAFGYGDDSTFMDPAIVEVSEDGETWIAFPHDYVAQDERMYSARREHWIGFAGVTPVWLHAEDNPVDPFGDEAGGDRFDLAALPESEHAARIRTYGARFVRITAAPSRVNPDTGEPYVQDPVSNGPDVDGVFARTLVEEP